jgi:hypothetical protein
MILMLLQHLLRMGPESIPYQFIFSTLVNFVRHNNVQVLAISKEAFGI